MGVYSLISLDTPQSLQIRSEGFGFASGATSWASNSS
jgi:hypothetical protein